MFCPNCSADKFDVVKVVRNRRYNPEKKKWYYSDHHDIRKVLCSKCGTTFLTETRIVHKVELLPNGKSSVEWEPNEAAKEEDE